MNVALSDSYENRKFPIAPENVKKVFHKRKGESTERFSSNEGDRQRSLKEYIMRIIEVIQTEEWPRGCVIYLTFSSKA